jgi:hypothetical protein
VRPVAATLALVLIAAAFPQFAAAQDDGVFFDPGGPSDKEYAMPHDQARGGGGDKGSSDKGNAPGPGQSGGGPSSGQGGGSGGSGSSGGSGGGQATPQQGSSDAQLFGQGVTRAQSERKRDRNGADKGSGTPPALSGGRDSAVGLAPASADTDTATGLGWFLAIAAAVALLGGGLAYITRSRTRGPAT